MATYATTSDLAERVTGLDESSASALLRYASLLVRKATRRAHYIVDTAGLPTSTRVLAAFRDATVEQAVAWAKNKIDPSMGAAGLPATRTSRSLGGASYGVAVSTAAEDDRANLAGGQTLSRWAYLILDGEGLIDGKIGASSQRGVYRQFLDEEEIVDLGFPTIFTLGS